jgi:hypothetical protein
LYNVPELRRMYTTVTRNLRKRKHIDGTWYLETTTMFAPGEESIAEATYGEAEALREGRKKKGRHRLLYDHRWGEAVNLSDELELRAALTEAYGEALRWMDLDGLVDEFYDTRNAAADSRRYFLNAQTSSSDSWIDAHFWDGCARPGLGLRPGDMVCLGLDGSVGGPTADATALVAVRVSDGHSELLECWEKPEGPEGEDWQVDRVAVDAAVAGAMERFEVVGFFADPAHWQDTLADYHNQYAHLMSVKATEKQPLHWWTNRPRPMVAALERLHEAIVEQRLTFTPAQDRVGRQAELAVTLRRHVLNAKRRVGRSGITIAKDFPHSPRKIDSCMALCLAYEAACQARAAGIRPRGEMYYAARRIR